MLRPRGTRLLAAGGLVLLAFLYWKPAHAYLHAKRELQTRRAEVQTLRSERVRLQRRIAQAGTGDQFVREARRLGLVKPGEKLFIVKDIAAWRKHH
jgi:cell division protein FtsB